VHLKSRGKHSYSHEWHIAHILKMSPLTRVIVHTESFVVATILFFYMRNPHCCAMAATKQEKGLEKVDNKGD
jgi:hypothetical protein